MSFVSSFFLKSKNRNSSLLLFSNKDISNGCLLDRSNNGVCFTIIVMIAFCPVILYLLGHRRSLYPPFICNIGCFQLFSSLCWLQSCFLFVHEIVHMVLVCSGIWSFLPATIWFLWEIRILVCSCLLMNIWSDRFLTNSRRPCSFVSLQQILTYLTLTMRSNVAVCACIMRRRNVIKDCHILNLLTHYCTYVLLIFV